MDWLIDILTRGADAIAHAAGLVPPQGWAALLGLFTSVLWTQRAKFWLPVEWPERLRAFLCQAIAFLTAVAVTAWFWRSVAGLLVGSCVGIASPTLYALAVRRIGVRWPEVRDLLSQDTRREDPPK